jgi:hypothetical protein
MKAQANYNVVIRQQHLKRARRRMRILDAKAGNQSILFFYARIKAKKFSILLKAAAIFLCLAITPVQAQSNNDIAQRIIAESLANYSGNCPCPYNTDRAGRRCGKRSAYSKPGGYSPICYKEDVTPTMIKSYQARHGQEPQNILNTD